MQRKSGGMRGLMEEGCAECWAGKSLEQAKGARKGLGDGYGGVIRVLLG